MDSANLPSFNSFIEFLDYRISYLDKCGRIGTSRNYRRAKSSLLRFLDGNLLTFADLNSSFIDSYQDWLMSRGMCRNSASFHLRILRAVYNKAVKQGLVSQSFPFSGCYTGVDATAKRCVGSEIVKRLKTLDLKDNQPLLLARDLFLFSIYTRGMSFVDMAYLKKKDIAEEEIIYVRRKTKGILRIHVEKETACIINRYRASRPESPYVFPLLSEGESKKCYDAYQKALALYNYRLKKLSEMLGLCRRLTSYVARHTWASLAYHMSVPVSVISTGMGHKSEMVTRIYLDSLENGVVDDANRMVIGYLN